MTNQPAKTRPGGCAARNQLQQKAFTLIELLVVVSIITLLMSILTPSVGRARQQAKSTVCLSRLSEFMKGLVAYEADYGFRLPPLTYPAYKVETGDPADVPLHGWAEALYRSLYNEKAYPIEEYFPAMRNSGNRYELWTCVEGRPLTNHAGHYRAYEVSWSYGALDRVNHRLPIIMDANPLVEPRELFDPANDYFRSDVPKEHIAGLEGEAYIDERHYGGANYAFSDGHAIRSTTLKEQLAENWELNPNIPSQYPRP